MAAYEMQKLKYSFFVKNGATPSSGVSEYWDGDIMWITPADYTTEQCYIAESRRSITEAGLNSCGTNLVPEGSVIVSNRAPIGLIGIAAKPLCTSQGCKSLVKKKNGAINEKFVYYYLTTQEKALNALGRGTTFFELSSFDLANFQVALPIYTEQNAIVAYLDSRTAQIDTLIADLQSQMEMLDRYKRELIAEAVTKGLDKSATMKDSGAGWIGEVPEHWKITRIGSLYSERSTKVSDVDYPALSVTKNGIVPQLESVALTDHGDNRKLVKAGDFVINSRSDRRGSCGISPLDGSVTLISIVLKPNGDIYNPYYNYIFRSVAFADEFYKWGYGIVNDLWSTKWSTMKVINIQNPPIEEQRQIADYLDSKIPLIEGLITDITAQIEKLKQYRQFVIHDAVTGKIKVTEG